MKLSRKLQVLVFVVSLMPLCVVVAVHGDLQDQSFNAAAALGGVVALLSGFVVVRPVRNWLYLSQVLRIKEFCASVRRGDFGSGFALPNQNGTGEDENELLDLMREIDWMANRIQRRESELRETIQNLELASRQITVQSEARGRVQNLLNRFLAPEMAAQLLEVKDIRSLNKRAELSILFSDIRGFTGLAETMAPEALVDILNPYLEAMTAEILKHGGTVDKYEGDAVIAFFGEPVVCPDHALRAARAAVGMRQSLARLNREWQRKGIMNSALEIGIGIHTGEAFVGLLGSDQRVTYTVIGDNVNLASRLQDQTKALRWPILISETTARLIVGEFGVDFAAKAVLRGKTEPVNIYRLKSVRRKVESAYSCGDEPERTSQFMEAATHT